MHAIFMSVCIFIVSRIKNSWVTFSLWNRGPTFELDTQNFSPYDLYMINSFYILNFGNKFTSDQCFLKNIF
jgi:hypothetical protein